MFAAKLVAHAPAVTLHARRQDDPTAPTRWTVAAGRRVGSAVVRNRAKRRLRHAIAEAGLPLGLDVVAVAKPARADRAVPGVGGADPGGRPQARRRGPVTLALIGSCASIAWCPKGPVTRCRFHPTCSAYALEALEVHGAVRGTWLAARRIARCHPFHPGGVDHVPPPVVPPLAAGGRP